MTLPRIAILTGSTRPGRASETVARWVMEAAALRGDAHFELVDIADHPLPWFDEPQSPSKGNYLHDHTLRWSRIIATFDGYVFVTPEYNHSIPGALKNAIDYLYHEWADKVAGFVSYGGRAGGARAIEQLRLVLASLMVAGGRMQLMLSTHADFVDRQFRPAPSRAAELAAMLDEIVDLTIRSRVARAARTATTPATGRPA